MKTAVSLTRPRKARPNSSNAKGLTQKSLGTPKSRGALATSTDHGFSPKPKGPQSGKTAGIQRKRSSGGGAKTAEVIPEIRSAIDSSRGRGQQLHRPLRKSAEDAFGHDFSKVRVHTDSRSDRINRGLGSRALTTGRDMFFRSGEYNPESRSTQRLVGHELTHVVQQSSGRVPNHDRMNVDSNPGLEHEADRFGDRMARGQNEPSRNDSLKAMGYSTSMSVQLDGGDPWDVGEMDAWLQQKAEAQGKSKLYEYYDGLDPAQKKIALEIVIGKGEGKGQGLSTKTAKRRFMRWYRRSKIDWARFANAIQVAKRVDVTNYNEDALRDYLGYGLDIGGPTVGMVRSAPNALMSVTTSGGKLPEGVEAMGPVGSGIGILGGLAQTYRSEREAFSNVDSYSNAEFSYHHARGLAGLGDVIRHSGTMAIGISKTAGTAISAGAVKATGAGAIIGGAYYLASGLTGAISSHGRIGELGKVKERTEEGSQLNKAAKLAQSTQRLRRTVSGATALKGAGLIAGGALLLALGATNPAGWIALGVAGAIGGIAALYSFWKKRRRRSQMVDQILGMADYTGKDKKAEKNRRIQAMGFSSESQVYVNYVNETAEYLYNEGVMGDNEDARAILENMGLNVSKENRQKGRPSKALIAKKLHTP